MIPIFICYQSTVERTNERTNEGRKERKKLHSSSSKISREHCPHVPKPHQRPLRSAIAAPRVGRGGRSGAIAQQWRRNDPRCQSVRYLFRHGVQWLSAGVAQCATRDGTRNATRYGPPAGHGARNVARGPDRGRLYRRVGIDVSEFSSFRHACQPDDFNVSVGA
jgi:hypothetical protein